VRFEVELSQTGFYTQQPYLPVDLIITNTSQRTVLLEDIRVIPSSPQLQVEVSEPLSNIIPDGEILTTQVEVETVFLDEGYYEAIIEVVTTAGIERVRLEVVPQPDVVPVTGKYELLLDLVQSEQNFAHINIRQGVITVEELSTDVPWAEVRTRQEYKLPFTLDARSTSTLPLEFVFDERALLDQAREFPFEYPGNLIIRYREFEKLRSVPFQVICYKPPELYVWESEVKVIKLRAGRQESFTLTLQNTDITVLDGDIGRGILEIRAIEVFNMDGSPCTWLKQTASIEFPLRISSGKFMALSFAIETTEGEPGSPDQIGVGTHSVAVIITTNVPESKKRYFFEFDVQRMPVHEGMLVVDFGTSNTCAALLSLGGLGIEDLIPIDETFDASMGERPTTAPSVIQYLDLLETGVKEYQIGSGPAGLAHLSPSVVVSPKRGLETNQKYSIVFSMAGGRKTAEYTPREVIADYLRRVKEISEDHIRARIYQVTIAHPSRFSLRQIKELERATREAFGESCSLEKIHEPIAAALDFIVTPEAVSRESYTLMVYDFGGGTTDVTLLQIENQHRGSYCVVTPQVLGAAGNPRLGGTEVTEIVMKLGLKRAEKVVVSKFPEATAGQILINLESFRYNPQRRRAVIENRSTLLRWAEPAKIALSNYGDRHQPPANLGFIPLHILIDDRQMTHNFYHEDIVPRLEELNSELEVFLNDAMLLTKKLAEEGQVEAPDVILLAGKSSALPIVKEMLRRYFPTSEICYPSSDLKECVVHGACIKERYKQPFVDVRLNLDEAAIGATTSRIGVPRLKGGHCYFEGVFGAGVPIPETGLKKRLEGLPPLTRKTRITILENVGGNDDYMVSGKRNPDIDEIAVFELTSLPPDISDAELSQAALELEVNRNLDIVLRAYISGRDEPIIFGMVKGDGEGERTHGQARGSTP
jgi:molecular chaperone DnaK (HSP70)